MSPPISDLNNERRLELHFQESEVEAGASFLTALPMAATFGLTSDEWLRPEFLFLLDDVTASAFQITTLSIRAHGFEGHEVVIPMHLEPKDAHPGAAYRLEAREAPPGLSYIFLEARNTTDETQNFSAAMSLIAVRGSACRASAPFTPIAKTIFGHQANPSTKTPNRRERWERTFVTIINGFQRSRMEYQTLKASYLEFKAAKQEAEQKEDLYPNPEVRESEERETETIRGIITRSIREGLALAAFPLRVGSMMANKGLVDLKKLLSGTKEKLSGKETILACTPTTVDAGNESVVFIEPKVRMVPTRLVVSYEISNDFSLVDFKVGRNSQLLTDLPIPFSILAGLGESVRLKMEEAGPNKPISISVQNTSMKTAKFRAVVIGYAVE